MTNRLSPPIASRGWHRFCRASALALTVALTAGIGAVGAAEAAESDPGVAVTWVTRPVDPQPVVAGHEGDILLEVNVVMAGTATPAKPRPKAAKAKHRR